MTFETMVREERERIARALNETLDELGTCIDNESPRALPMLREVF